MNHHTIKHDLDEAQNIWRYMDKSKFALLMCEKKLWFSRSDLLGDEHEGSLPRAMIEKRKIRWSNENLRHRLERGSKEGVKHVFVSCWTMQEPESYAMWKIYTPNAIGIAIKSTVGRLSSCFVKRPNDLFDRLEPRIDETKYINFDKFKEYDDDYYERFLHKQEAYAYEKEIRALVSFMPTVETPPLGISLEVDLDILIDRIYVSHRLGDGLEDFVKYILHDKGLQKEVIHPPFVRSPNF